MMSRRVFAVPLILASLSSAPAASAAVPEPAADHALERALEPGEQWKDKLGLTADQARRLSLLEKEKDQWLRPLREILRQEMVRLQTCLAENGTEREIEESLEQILQVRRAIALRSEKVDAGLAAFLAPSQRARLLVWRSLGGLDGYASRRLEASRPEWDGERE